MLSRHNREGSRSMDKVHSGGCLPRSYAGWRLVRGIIKDRIACAGLRCTGEMKEDKYKVGWSRTGLVPTIKR